MGLDISAFSRLTPAENVPCDEHGHPIDWEHFVRFTRGHLQLSAEHDYGHANDLRVGIYSWERELNFRAGSYSGYNDWRNWLAQRAGWPSAPDLWKAKPATGPFVELINFSDCEGLIGPRVSKKLLHDFEQNCHTIAKDYNGQLYLKWFKAFELAADGGAVWFH
jgi:hypothetical protein